MTVLTTPLRWCGTRWEVEWKERPWGSDSHIPQSLVYQGQTYPSPHFLSPTPPFNILDPPQSARAGTWETVLILPRGLLAWDTIRGLRREKMWEHVGEGIVQYVRTILIKHCSAMSCFSWEFVRGTDRRERRCDCFPRSWTAGLTTGAKLNSGLGHWKQIPGYHHHTTPPQDLLQSACN